MVAKRGRTAGGCEYVRLVFGSQRPEAGVIDADFLFLSGAAASPIVADCLLLACTCCVARSKLRGPRCAMSAVDRQLLPEMSGMRLCVWLHEVLHYIFTHVVRANRVLGVQVLVYPKTSLLYTAPEAGWCSLNSQ